MRGRGAPVFAWGVWALVLVLVGVVTASTVSLLVDDPLGMVFPLVLVAFATVGAVVTARAPHNRIGLVFLAAALFGGIFGLADRYAQTDGPGSVAVWMAWIGQVSWSPYYMLLVVLPVWLFPDGRPPSSRWRWVGWAMLVAVVGLMPVGALQHGPLETMKSEQNPLGVTGFHPEQSLIAAVLLWTGGGAFLASIVGAGASMVSRFRRSRGEEHQQLKWFAYAATWTVAGFAVFFLVGVVPDEIGVEVSGWLEAATGLVALLGLLALPMAAGLAILRYRLYDIDLVINRTLVYVTLTVTLGAVYVTGVVGLPRLVQIGEGNDLAVAASTLAVAALFNPLRRRVQGFVDRRFYRSRYDSAQTIEAFSARLRENMDMEQLESELSDVVQDALQPASVGMWLKQPPASAATGRPGSDTL